MLVLFHQMLCAGVIPEPWRTRSEVVGRTGNEKDDTYDDMLQQKKQLVELLLETWSKRVLPCDMVSIRYLCLLIQDVCASIQNLVNLNSYLVVDRGCLEQ